MSNIAISQTESSPANEICIEVENSVENLNVVSENHVIQLMEGTQDSSKEVPPRKGRKKMSSVWEYFVEVPCMKKGVPSILLQCNCCRTKFHKSKSGTTSQLLRHVRDCERIKSKNKQSELCDKRQKILNFLPSDVDANIHIPISVDPKNFDQFQIREIIAKMIIAHEYPFMMVEHTWFNILLKVLNPNYERVSRNTIKNDCMKVYEFEKEKLKGCLKHVHRVSLTSDCWTSNQTIGYMCLTVHYIDDSWALQSRIINFVELEPPHTGTYICDAISECLLEWNLQDKVSTITLDNASNNDVAATALKANFQSRGKLHFQGHFFHVRCCAHILNIMVQDGLREVAPIIHQIRESIKYLKKSPARLHKFVEVSKQLGVPTVKGLCIDVPTRWNSTYMMLESAFIYRTVFSHYADRDNNYKWLPSELDWGKYEKIRKYLEVFNNVTKMISGSRYPTTNLFLPTVMHVKKLLMEESKSTDDYMRQMAIAMTIKFEKYWGNCNLLMAVAAVLDPRLKMKFINFTFPKIYFAYDLDHEIQLVEKVLWEIYDQYAVDISTSCSLHCIGSSNSLATMTSSPTFDSLLGFTDFIVASGSIQPPKADLQIYLEEGLYHCNNSDFDVLEWWKTNTLKYPCLSKMAKDVLTIPITTVASESAFSAGGRVLDDFRSSLSTKTVNALVCTASWLRSAQNSIQTHLDIEGDENLCELTRNLVFCWLVHLLAVAARFAIRPITWSCSV